MTCNAEGDELTSVAKILFFLVHLSRLYLKSVPDPFQVRCKSVLTPFLGMGGKWDLHRTYMGGRREVVLFE